MFSKVKEVFKRFLPPPTHTFLREISRILDGLQQQQNQLKGFNDGLQQQQNQLKNLNEVLQQQQTQLKSLHEELQQQQKSLKTQREMLEAQSALAKMQNESLKQQLAIASRTAQEGVWANVFHDTIRQSSWLKDQTFSPGRWAVGYSALYTIYRILNEAKPKRILELGLGQSTRMIAQYAAAYEDVEHMVVEHDQDWIDFWGNNFSPSQRTQIIRLEREMACYKDVEQVRVFKGFAKQFEGEKFDFIFIDAPLGSDMKVYSRIDVLNCIPQCLQKSFVILLDDYMRSGEKNTAAEMIKKLDEKQIGYASGKYDGGKDIFVLASPDLKFLTSL